MKARNPTDALTASELEALMFAEHCAGRDIRTTGEFSNPFNPLNDSLRFRAYEAFVDAHNLEIELLTQTTERYKL